MYYEFDDYEPEWEPSEADELFEEIKQKLLSAAKGSLKSEYEKLQNDNAYLTKRNADLEKKFRDIERRERDLKYKEENLAREVERNMYKKFADDILADAIDKMDIWICEKVGHERPKCNLCNDRRLLVHIWPDGSRSEKRCKCAEKDYYYESMFVTIEIMRYRVRNSNYPSERFIKLDKKYHNPMPKSYDDDSWCDLSIQDVFEEFNEDVKKLEENRSYSQRFGFKSKEECQKYCDWRNNKENADIPEENNDE